MKGRIGGNMGQEGAKKFLKWYKNGTKMVQEGQGASNGCTLVKKVQKGVIKKGQKACKKGRNGVM